MLKSPLKLCAAVFGTAAIIAMGLTWAQEPRILNALPDENPGILMQAKLASTSKIMEGLMSGDYARIEDGARQLSQICEAKNWRRLEDSTVVHYRAELRRCSQKLERLANEQNLDGSAYAFTNALSTCINCHQYSRDTLQIARLDSAIPIPTAVYEPQPNQPVMGRQ